MSSLFRVLLVAIAVGLVLWGGTIITRVVIIENMAWSDVIPLHTGCQTFFKGQPPYDDVVTARIQSRLTVATENEQRFAYPAHMCLVLAPIWLLPYDIAAPLWTFLQLMLFAALPLLIFNHILHTPISPLRMAVLLLFSLLGYRYTMMTIVLGQYTGFTMWCLLGAAWALSQRRAGLAALLMATMTVRAEAAIFAGILALLALYRRQWRVVVLWLAIGLGLWLGATAAIGPWIGAFITRMGTYNSYTETQWLPLYHGPIGACRRVAGMEFSADSRQGGWAFLAVGQCDRRRCRADPCAADQRVHAGLRPAGVVHGSARLPGLLADVGGGAGPAGAGMGFLPAGACRRRLRSVVLPTGACRAGHTGPQTQRQHLPFDRMTHCEKRPNVRYHPHRRYLPPPDGRGPRLGTHQP